MKITKVHRKQIKKAFSPNYTTAQGITSLARLLGTTDQVSRRIVTGNCLVSASRAVLLESLTGIPADVLRPDIFKKRAAKNAG